MSGKSGQWSKWQLFIELGEPLYDDSLSLSLSLSLSDSFLLPPSLPPPSIVPVSEASIAVAVSAEHRAEAIEAVAFAVDAVKATAAIWKKVSL